MGTGLRLRFLDAVGLNLNHAILVHDQQVCTLLDSDLEQGFGRLAGYGRVRHGADAIRFRLLAGKAGHPSPDLSGPLPPPTVGLRVGGPPEQVQQRHSGTTGGFRLRDAWSGLGWATAELRPSARSRR